MQIFIKRRFSRWSYYFIKCERQRILRGDKETGDGCVTGVSGRSADWRRHYAENAEEFLTAGASHVIVTSYVFCDGKIQMDRLKKLRNAVGKEHLVLDLSCRKKDGKYYIVTDRWQRFTEQMITEDLLEQTCRLL